MTLKKSQSENVNRECVDRDVHGEQWLVSAHYSMCLHDLFLPFRCYFTRPFSEGPAVTTLAHIHLPKPRPGTWYPSRYYFLFMKFFFFFCLPSSLHWSILSFEGKCFLRVFFPTISPTPSRVCNIQHTQKAFSEYKSST